MAAAQNAFDNQFQEQEAKSMRSLVDLSFKLESVRNVAEEFVNNIFEKEHWSYDRYIKSMIEYRVGKPYTILISGKVNSGKSSFITELLRGEFRPPTSETECTRGFVQLDFTSNTEPQFREDNDKEEEFQLEEGYLPAHIEGRLVTKGLCEDHRTEKSYTELLDTEFSIKLNCDLLQKVRVIDSPGLSDPTPRKPSKHATEEEKRRYRKKLEEIEKTSSAIKTINRFQHYKPDLILYIFDSRESFTWGDRNLFYRIRDTVDWLTTNCALLLVGNKVDVNKGAKVLDNTAKDQVASVCEAIIKNRDHIDEETRKKLDEWKLSYEGLALISCQSLLNARFYSDSLYPEEELQREELQIYFNFKSELENEILSAMKRDIRVIITCSFIAFCYWMLPDSYRVYQYALEKLDDKFSWEDSDVRIMSRDGSIPDLKSRDTSDPSQILTSNL